MAWLQATPASKPPGRAAGALTPRDGRDAKSDAFPAVSMYREAPGGEVVIEDFERFAIARLKVLKGIDDLKLSGKKKGDELHAAILELDKKHLKGGTREENWWRDQVSHFVLRLAYCSGEDNKRFFLQQEAELFAARFREEPGKAQFLKKVGLGYQPLPAEEVDPSRHPADSDEAEAARSLQGRLVEVAAARHDVESVALIRNGRMEFFKVAWEDVPDLVSRRQVLLMRGDAYVQRDQVGSLLVRHFRDGLAKGLAKTAARWQKQTAVAEAGRLTPVVESLSKRYLGPDYGEAANENRDAVSAAQVPALARESFPLCMALMTRHLHSDAHLKHAGRMQLGLFLKGIGLPLEEALRFWRQEFAPKTPPEKFDKEYRYNVEHNYGKQGGRKNYTPYSCLKIISATPGVDDHHGCPYKTLRKEDLRAELQRLRIAPFAVEEAVTKAKNGHYQLACGVAFSGAHGGCACDTGINHPNQYYDESRKVLAKQQAEAAPKTPAATPARGPRPASGTPPAPAS